MVAECFEESEGTDVHCRGEYAPSSASSSADATTARPVLLRFASAKLKPGTRRDVRLVGGTAFEPPPGAAAEYVAHAGWVAAGLGIPGHWLLTSARRGRFLDGEHHVAVWFASLFGAVVLGLLSLPVAWLLATVRG